MIEIIAIGNEILSGRTVNSNAAYISKKLRAAGFSIHRHTTLSDDPGQLKIGLSEALTRSEIVITTGGLGPTFDDVTKDVASDLFQTELYLDETLKHFLLSRFGLFPTIDHQATVPRDAHVFPNELGSASGLGFPKEKPKLFMLPGVPREMEKMLDESIIPFLGDRNKQPCFETEVHLTLLKESDVAPHIESLQSTYPSIEFGIYPAYGMLTVVLRASSKESLEPALAFLQSHYQTYVFPSDTIEKAVQELFIEKKITLSLAESCSGGSIAAKITQISRSSDYFLGSFVTYSNLLKHNALDVSKTTLNKTGAVSRETAIEMLLGAIEKSGSDYAIAVTGIAGPTGGSEEKPVGTVWAAIGAKGEEPDVGLLPIIGQPSRGIIIEYCANYLLGSLYRKVQFGKKAFADG